MIKVLSVSVYSGPVGVNTYGEVLEWGGGIKNLEKQLNLIGEQNIISVLPNPDEEHGVLIVYHTEGE